MRLYKANGKWFFKLGKTTTSGKSLKWVLVHSLNIGKYFSLPAMLGYAIACIDLVIILIW